MTRSRALLAVFLFFSLIFSACVPTQTAIETAVAQTPQISQLETAAAGVAGEPTKLPEATKPEARATEEIPTDTAAPPEEIAPDPLSASTTGVALNNGECFNFDNGQVTEPDSECDVWLPEPALFRQINGMQLSGYVTLTAPTRTYCGEGRYEPGDLAVQTDMYMCFITNEGRVGFVVARSYLGEPISGIVFDYWVFD